jgi:hypothetical protein
VRTQFAEPPAHLKSVELAIAWGMESGVSRNEAHTRNADKKVKREERSKSAAEMGNMWATDVERRILEAELGEEEE